SSHFCGHRRTEHLRCACHLHRVPCRLSLRSCRLELCLDGRWRLRQLLFNVEFHRLHHLAAKQRNDRQQRKHNTFRWRDDQRECPGRARHDGQCIAQRGQRNHWKSATAVKFSEREFRKCRVLE